VINYETLRKLHKICPEVS